jgi:uncharacterized protein (DUF2236 family)
MADSRDVGLFGPGSVTWRVHAEPVLLVAGLRSLFLQSLHPRAVAGVVQNSGYKSDPWGRLLRTINYVAIVVYGTTTKAEAAGRRVRSIHASLTATDPRSGESFRIDEPDLLRWVHVTEVESFLDTAKRAGVPLTESDVDGYYTEQRRAAALVGLDPASVPGTAAEVDAYYRQVRPELAMTPDAARTLAFLAVAPLPWRLELTPAPAGLRRCRRDRVRPAAAVGAPPLRPAGPAQHGSFGHALGSGHAHHSQRAAPPLLRGPDLQVGHGPGRPSHDG